VAFLVLLGASVVLGMFVTNGLIGDLAIDIIIGFVLPVPAITTTLLYYDLRVRTESADLDAMLATLPPSAPAV
jgi:hypothetical protein